MKKDNLKNVVTNWVALLLIVLGAVISYLQLNAGKPIDWQQVTICVLLAVVSFFTGKNPDGSKKTPEQIDAQLNPKE